MLPRTQRQKEVLDYITRFLAKHGHEPSYAQIARYFGVSSKATIAKHITALEKRGLIKRDHQPGRFTLIDRARATLKRLFRFGEDVELRPSNSQLEPIRIHASRVEIQGIFRGLMRPNS